MIVVYSILAVALAGLSTYFAIKSQEFRKFLSGAFLVSSGVLFYLSLARVSVPILGARFVQTPEVAGRRAVLHFVFFLLSLYFGYIRKPKTA